MKNFFTMMCILLSCGPILAQNSRQEKRLLKSLKKEYDLLYSDFRENCDDGYRYIYIRTKNGYTMIADSTGNIIIPYTYPSQNRYRKIEYYPSHKKGCGTKYKYGSQQDFFYVGSQGAFVAEDKSGVYHFYNQKGMKLSEFAGYLQECYSTDAYLATSFPVGERNIFIASSTLTNNHGLLAKDGTVLIPISYSEINATNTGLCYVSKNENGIIKRGVINISNSNLTNVPCLFNNVVLSENNNEWLVAMHELDTLSVYFPNKVYSCSFIDEGEKLFESGQYEKVRKYYSIEHDDAPWANVYLGACGWKLAIQSFNTAKQALEALETTHAEHGYDVSNTVYDQLDLLEKESKLAIKHFDLYLQGEDEKYKPRIKEIKYDLEKIMEESDILRKSVARELEAYKYRREKYLEEERVEQNKMEIEYQQELQRINNQLQHERNERERIQLRMQEERRMAAARLKAKQRRSENNRSNRVNNNVPQHTNKRWHDNSIPKIGHGATSFHNKSTNMATTETTEKDDKK